MCVNAPKVDPNRLEREVVLACATRASYNILFCKFGVPVLSPYFGRPVLSRPSSPPRPDPVLSSSSSFFLPGPPHTLNARHKGKRSISHASSLIRRLSSMCAYSFQLLSGLQYRIPSCPAGGNQPPFGHARSPSGRSHPPSGRSHPLSGRTYPPSPAPPCPSLSG